VCGLAGIVSYTQTPDCALHVRSMIGLMSHRGESSAFYNNAQGSAYLGHRRLSILDLSTSADQPMQSSDGRFVIIFNGEIYNYKELKDELISLGERFCTSGDTEVVLSAYRIWGLGCLHKLRGMFAWALWDEQEKKLIAARDHTGIKPLYYSYDSAHKRFVFASELKALFTLPFVRRVLNKKALSDYLSFNFVSPPYTLLEDVYSLNPAHYLIFSESGLEIKSYWSLGDYATDEGLNDLEVVRARARELLEESTRFQMRSDVPVGAFLSGGLDSATIVGLMARHSHIPIKTFSIGFSQAHHVKNELSLARLVAGRYGTDHHEVVIDGEYFKAHIDGFVQSIDQPSWDGINSYLVSKIAGSHVRVALSGIGGDELFLGYRYFKSLALLSRMPSAALHCFEVLKKYAWGRSLMHRGGLDALDYFPPSFAAYKKMRSLFSVQQQVLLCSWLNHFSAVESDVFSREPDVLNAFSKAELAWYTPGVLLRDMDVTSMASTLEVRVPFLDHKLIEFMLSVPSRFKVQPFQKTNKPLLTSLFHDLVPSKLLEFPKQGFEMPIGFWLKEYMYKQLACITSNVLFNSEQTKKLYEQFLRDPRDYRTIWALFILMRWSEQYDISWDEEASSSTLYSSWNGDRGRSNQPSNSC
jgi:asparagine synthase (glutamine-hydrolysing)